MSTANFSLVNAKKYYAVKSTFEYENEEGQIEEQYKESWDWENDIEVFGENIPSEYSMNTRGDYVGYDRNYPQTACEKSIAKEFKFGGVEVEVGLIPVLRSGYYDGANWDYVKYVRMERDWESDDDVDDSICAENVSLFCQNAFENRGFAKIIAPKLYKKIAGVFDELDDVFSNIAEQMCDMKLACVGVFSNGEAVYEREN